jgi:hypothetical protein
MKGTTIRSKRTPDCHPDKKHIAKGLCSNCYQSDLKINNPEYAEKQRQSYRDWRKKNIQHTKDWKKVNAGKVNASTAKRRAAKLRATPAWADLLSIRKIYEECPKGHHVDHIIPLQGKRVCGLHVEYNLQYLPARDNILKHNKF